MAVTQPSYLYTRKTDFLRAWSLPWMGGAIRVDEDERACGHRRSQVLLSSDAIDTKSSERLLRRCTTPAAWGYTTALVLPVYPFVRRVDWPSVRFRPWASPSSRPRTDALYSHRSVTRPAILISSFLGPAASCPASPQCAATGVRTPRRNRAWACGLGNEQVKAYGCAGRTGGLKTRTSLSPSQHPSLARSTVTAPLDRRSHATSSPWSPSASATGCKGGNPELYVAAFVTVVDCCTAALSSAVPSSHSQTHATYTHDVDVLPTRWSSSGVHWASGGALSCKGGGCLRRTASSEASLERGNIQAVLHARFAGAAGRGYYCLVLDEKQARRSARFGRLQHDVSAFDLGLLYPRPGVHLVFVSVFDLGLFIPGPTLGLGQTSSGSSSDIVEVGIWVSPLLSRHHCSKLPVTALLGRRHAFMNTVRCCRPSQAPSAAHDDAIPCDPVVQESRSLSPCPITFSIRRDTRVAPAKQRAWVSLFRLPTRYVLPQLDAAIEATPVLDTLLVRTPPPPPSTPRESRCHVIHLGALDRAWRLALRLCVHRLSLDNTRLYGAERPSRASRMDYGYAGLRACAPCLPGPEFGGVASVPVSLSPTEGVDMVYAYLRGQGYGRCGSDLRGNADSKVPAPSSVVKLPWSPASGRSPRRPRLASHRPHRLHAPCGPLLWLSFLLHMLPMHRLK
ncbi:hypothetical protein MSAN_01993800 [Mycena sanguinolenta]|uniref:Uncharacterized protein n=1 Tax=Mycena sanguinolenta TaxID=230812 RepID=A0A8H6XJL6_9AGAR|nr:hypothetical protein MSAN_01993800 [Mycena sanguinolenta]